MKNRLIPELYVIRHGETNYNRQRIIQGRGIDSSLNETGQWQAQRFFDAYQHLKFDAIFASALVRTHQTVAPFKAQNIDIQTFAELDEINWGIHEGIRPSPENHQEYKQLMKDWKSGKLNAKIRGGESPLEVQIRLQAFLQYLHQQKYQKVLICTHGRTSRILFCTLLGKSLTHMSDFNHRNTALAKFVGDKNKLHYRLIFHNNIEHLKKEEYKG